MALVGMEYLRNKLVQKRGRVRLRYRYYDMKNGVQYLRTLIPPEFMWMAADNRQYAPPHPEESN